MVSKETKETDEGEADKEPMSKEKQSKTNGPPGKIFIDFS